jgi:hypothetical protein
MGSKGFVCLSVIVVVRRCCLLLLLEWGRRMLLLFSASSANAAVHCRREQQIRKVGHVEERGKEVREAAGRGGDRFSQYAESKHTITKSVCCTMVCRCFIRRCFISPKQTPK